MRIQIYIYLTNKKSPWERGKKMKTRTNIQELEQMLRSEKNFHFLAETLQGKIERQLFEQQLTAEISAAKRNNSEIEAQEKELRMAQERATEEARVKNIVLAIEKVGRIVFEESSETEIEKSLKRYFLLGEKLFCWGVKEGRQAFHHSKENTSPSGRGRGTYSTWTTYSEWSTDTSCDEVSEENFLKLVPADKLEEVFKKITSDAI